MPLPPVVSDERETGKLMSMVKTITLAILMGYALGLPAGWTSDLESEAVMESPVNVSIRNGAFSIDVEGLPLNTVLQEVGRQANIIFVIPDSADSPLVSYQFQNLSREDGIRQLLKGYNYVVEYDRSAGLKDQALAPTIKVRILEGKVLDKQEILASSRTRTEAPPRGASGTNDPAARAKTLRDLADQGDQQQLIKALNDAVHDQNQMVREVALDLMQNLGQNAPANLMTELALKDPNPGLRGKALQLLANTHRAVALTTLQQALQDENTEVRELASGLLENLSQE